MSRSKTSPSSATSPTEDARPEPVSVRIAGHEYKIRSDGDADGLREIAGYVDRAMACVREGTGTVDTLDVAVLTCLNLAREILTLREERAPADTAVVPNENLTDLIARIENALIDPAVIERIEAETETETETATDVASSDTSASDQEGSGSASVSGRTRTLELPSVEALHERAPKSTLNAAEEAVALDSALDAPRVAAGGRDRAS